MPKKPPKLNPPNNRVTRRMKRVWVTSGGRQVQKLREETKAEARARIRRERAERRRRIHAILDEQEAEEELDCDCDRDECPGDVTVTVTVTEPDIPSPPVNAVVIANMAAVMRYSTAILPRNHNAYGRDNPLLNEQGIRCFPESNQVHMEGCLDGDHVLEPLVFLNLVQAIEDSYGPNEYLRQLRAVYRQAVSQRQEARGRSSGWSYPVRPTHHNMREVVGENGSVRVFQNTRDVASALDGLEELTDLILEHHWAVSTGAKTFFADVFSSAIDMAQSVYLNQRVSGKQMRAIANWTAGVERWCR